MRRTSPHHADVFSHLPVALMRELDSAPVADVLEQLVAAGWRTGQLRARVGSEPSQGSPERDAEHLLALMRALLLSPAPDVAHARLREERERAREEQARRTPPPASPEVRESAIAEIRSGLKGLPRRRTEPEPRTRPACSLCDGEGAFFVTHDVHLCKACVAVLATGEARLSSTG